MWEGKGDKLTLYLYLSRYLYLYLRNWKVWLNHQIVTQLMWGGKGDNLTLFLTSSFLTPLIATCVRNAWPTAHVRRKEDKLTLFFKPFIQMTCFLLGRPKRTRSNKSYYDGEDYNDWVRWCGGLKPVWSIGDVMVTVMVMVMIMMVIVMVMVMISMIGSGDAVVWIQFGQYVCTSYARSTGH